ncbi:BQ2448_3753 [Microbotryum intermedium]|uniref:BQ2448_3753 protein n=1 Tax=Microbotryum intermedium TaxID=269621 RepID=A0A238FFT3_9BASI|nr:BQ2448_3753 [Microbotryum intermedium]
MVTSVATSVEQRTRPHQKVVQLLSNVRATYAQRSTVDYVLGFGLMSAKRARPDDFFAKA